MEYLKLKTIPSLLASFFLVYAFAAFADTENNDQTVPSECASSDAAMKQCTYFARGYLDALLQIDSEFGLNSNFSAFEERAYKTRVGKTCTTDFLKKELNLCLPKDISASEILTSIDNELPLKNALLKALQAKYPCHP